MVKEGKKIRDAARCSGIPFSTLQERIKKQNLSTPLMGRHTIFTKEQEDNMASRIRKLANIFYGCTAMEIRKMALRYAESNGIKHNFNKDSQAAGKDWLDGFLKRNSLSVRKAEGTSFNRAFAFNREEIGLFFELLGQVLEKFKFPPRNIYNVDETGVTTVQDPGKVVAAKGQKRVGSITSGERGQNVTAVCAVSATGQYVPPMFIYPRQRHSAALEKDGPREAAYKCSKNGWINEELFVDWLKHFVKFAKPTETDPVLLILDNRSSHTSWNAYQFCKQNNIVMLSLPPHGSHRIQPLDVSVYGPLKTAYKQECNIFMKCNMGRRITQNDIAMLFKKAFQRVATITNAESGFAASGIYPYNPNIFTNEDFLAAEINNEAFDADRINNYNRALESPSLLENPPEIAVQTSSRPLSAATTSSGTPVAVSAPDSLPPKIDHNILTPTSSSEMAAIPLPGLDCNILAPVSSPGTSSKAAPAPAIPLPGLDCNISAPTSSSGTSSEAAPAPAIPLPGLDFNILAPTSSSGISSEAAPAPAIPLPGLDCSPLAPKSSSETSRLTIPAPASLPSNQDCSITSVAKKTPASPLRSQDICMLTPTVWGTTDIAVLTSASQLPCLDREISSSKTTSSVLAVSSNVTPPKVRQRPSMIEVNYDNPIPSTSSISPIIIYNEAVSVKDLLPIPKKLEKKTTRTSRKQHATIITGTPNKIVLFEKEQKKFAKAIKTETKVKNRIMKELDPKKKNMKSKTKEKNQSDDDETDLGEDSENEREVKRIRPKNKICSKVRAIKKETLKTINIDNTLNFEETDLDEDSENERVKRNSPKNSKHTKVRAIKKETLNKINIEDNTLKQAKRASKKRKITLKKERKDNTTGVKRVKRKILQDNITEEGSTSNSDIDMIDLREDDDTDLDDYDSENKCVLCNDYGRNNELWYRCVYCGRWAHSECTGSDSPENYKCDLCNK
ncbi:hypothetical protein O0L34_g17508 [Tuta absoluta]|nr:hypothetical protein O0L34_g17508 [Tuta absoluta]